VLGREVQHLLHMLGATDHATTDGTPPEQEREGSEGDLAGGRAQKAHLTIPPVAFTYNHSLQLGEYNISALQTRIALLEDFDVCIPVQLS